MTAACAVLLAVLATQPAPAQPDEQFREQVAAARAKAVKFLKEQQKDGKWEPEPLGLLGGMEGGMTGLVALSLLETGVPADDPAVQKAIAYLAKLEPKKTYVVSLQTQVLARVDPKKHAALIQRNADWLLKTAIRSSLDKLLGWPYPFEDRRPVADGSNTHFAVVALHAAAVAGAKVDDKVWEEIHDMYTRTRRAEGWNYMDRMGAPVEPPSRTMTASALLGLTLAAKHDKQLPGNAFDKGMAVFAAGKPAYQGIGGVSEPYLLLTTAELGRALGTRTFKAGRAEAAWYAEGAAKLVKEQQPDGSWKLGKDFPATNPLYGTACALYFLGPAEKKGGPGKPGKE